MPSTHDAQALDNRTLSQLERDEEGFLLYTQDWHPGLLAEFASEAELPLNPERHEIIRYIRAYFEENQSVPEARKILKHMLSIWGKDKATRRYLYQLFPRGYGQQACKIAGMRKPLKLMLDI